jgi:L-alanine-DL-glutamate epimerase-like enolase superfamily enzyme
MKVQFLRLTVPKLHPFTISRGTIAASDNLFVTVEQDRFVGIGELCAGTDVQPGTAASEEQLKAFVDEGLEEFSIHEVYARMVARGFEGSTMAALEVALWDLHAKRCGVPLYRLLGLPKRQVPTSVTVGINPPEVVRERVPELLNRTGCKFLKIKLGSAEGIEADQASFEATREAAAPFGVGLRVDANGGWNLANAKKMLHWLAARGVAYVEQPLVKGDEANLPELYEGRPLPIFVDESVRVASDVPKVAGWVDGINLKLLKCGGIAEALRIVGTARALGLQTMIGCMSESSVGIAAGAAIGALFDHIDLDSNLNLNPDPAEGLDLVDGVVTPRDVPGHGAELKHA